MDSATGNPESGRMPAVPAGAPASPGTAARWLWALLPVVLLGAMVALFLGAGIGLPPRPTAPVEQVAFERPVLREGEIRLTLRNGGPADVQVTTVFVNDAVWEATLTPSATIPRLGRAVLHVPYHWVEGEPLKVTVLTANLIKFEQEWEAALVTPVPDARTFGAFFLTGLYVGVIPVGLGLLWFPFLRRMGSRPLNFILALTAGLLVFLAVDTLGEAFAVAGQVAGVFQAPALVVAGTLLSLLGLVAAGGRPARPGAAGTPDPAAGRLRVAWLIALGIGLHNLGEGLAIGAAYALGHVALGSFLVVGFTLHNVTEGVGIAAPVARDAVGWRRLAGLGALAGAPAILGTWVGGFFYNPLLAAVFLAVGAGAILQVIYEVGRLLYKGSDRPVSWANLGGLAAGMAVMWLTALLVKV